VSRKAPPPPYGEIHKVIKEIEKEAQRVHDTLDLLTVELSKAWGCYHIVNEIQQAYADKRINCLYYFLATTRASCENSVILILTNLLSQNKRNKTANVVYLLRVFESLACRAIKFTGITDPEDMVGISRTSALTGRMLDQNLLQKISQDKAQVEALEPVTEKLRSYRNTVVAHLDRKLVNDPVSLLSASPLHQDEIEAAFDFLFDLIRSYYWYLGYDFQFRDLSESLVEDFEYLVGLIEKDNERPITP
jgi:hypothetical protein